MSENVVGVDVGGTFTDLILIDEAGGGLRIAKVPSTPENQAFGVLAAIERAGVACADIRSIVHGTTTTTNAMLERRFARCGLITTRGFRDVLELGRRTRPLAYGMTGTFQPLIPRTRRLEVDERMDAEGGVVTPLDEEGVRAAVRRLLALGAESLVIHFLHSYVNPAHERRAAEIAAELWPNRYITAGSAVLAQFREYERGVTATVNAAVRPVLDRYIGRLRADLGDRGYTNDLLVMQGNGGTVSSAIVAETAVNTVLSGPASGVKAAAYVGAAAGFPDLVTYDMGGTSCDVALIRGGVPQVTTEFELEYAMPVHVPMVDIHTIGAGGGSVARVDEAGILQVGPESAGAVPGPICYGRGGARPTVTDANLVLGRLDPARLLSVDRPVPAARVTAAIERDIGAPLGLDGEAAAAAVLRIANHRMAGALRMVSLARGLDPRDFALFAFGGAGPLHAAALARELAIPVVLVPARPGITSALGCIVADVRHDYVRTVNRPVGEVDIDAARELLHAQAAEGRATIERERIPVEAVEAAHEADMQFEGQSHVLKVPLDAANLSREALHAAFEQAYYRRFEVRLPEIRPVLVSLRTAVFGRRKPVSLAAMANGGGRAADVAGATVAVREVWFDGGRRPTPVLSRDLLPAGARFDGPAIVEQLDCTTVIEPGNRVEADGDGNLIVTVPPRKGGPA